MFLCCPPQVRKAFCAEPGKTLIVADYGQLELRLLAHMANCRSMIRAFELGGDFHSRWASNPWLGICSERQLMASWSASRKAANFSLPAACANGVSLLLSNMPCHVMPAGLQGSFVPDMPWPAMHCLQDCAVFELCTYHCVHSACAGLHWACMTTSKRPSTGGSACWSGMEGPTTRHHLHRCSRTSLPANVARPR